MEGREGRGREGRRRDGGRGSGGKWKPLLCSLLSYKMRQCCRCNGSGRCKNCSCVKAGRACMDCLPSKKQACANLSAQAPPNSLSSSSIHQPTADSLPSEQSHMQNPAEESWEPHLMPTISDHSVGPPGPCSMPSFTSMANPEFMWGSFDSTSFTKMLEPACDETVHWRKNCFKIPQVQPLQMSLHGCFMHLPLPLLWSLLP